jgi:hypothetical protein
MVWGLRSQRLSETKEHVACSQQKGLQLLQAFGHFACRLLSDGMPRHH